MSSGPPQSPYREFSARAWGRLRFDTPLPLSEAELAELRGRGETISLSEVEQIYLPLSRLLNFYVAASQQLFAASNEFLGRSRKTPFIIGIAGSVAVGKSTTARLLRLLLARWPNHPKVELISTDNFLFSNAVLERRGLMHRKGFPDSFDVAALRRFLIAVKSGQTEMRAPIYSHFHYDILPRRTQRLRRPDILIVEGINVLQLARLSPSNSEIPFVSDFFDFSIYLDAATRHIQSWYVARFLELKRTSFGKPGAFFQRYADLSESAARDVADNIWASINLRNLEENILPTRGRADLILHKGANHRINKVRLRKI